jgi:hypothetical protein
MEIVQGLLFLLIQPLQRLMPAATDAEVRTNVLFGAVLNYRMISIDQGQYNLVG